jgi:hypothetical protein
MDESTLAVLTFETVPAFRLGLLGLFGVVALNQSKIM